jgi:hypothetical protein
MAERSLWNQDFIPSVEERFQPQRDLEKGSLTYGPRDRAYVMLSGFSLARCILIRISMTPSDMGDVLIPVPKCSK